MRTPLALLLGALLLAPAAPDDSNLRQALDMADRALESGDLSRARLQIERALERDRASREAWDLRARWARAVEDRDELLLAVHRGYRLALAQEAPKRERQALREELLAADPIAADLYGMTEKFVGKLEPLAEDYERDGRPHAAIRVLKQILALDPENAGVKAAIERIAASPDPSLAADAKPANLFEGISREWIDEWDAEHGSWKTKGKLTRENYWTYTDAGYEVLIRAGEAMEQMNAFYRQFFHYGTEEDGGSVSRIGLNIFKSREEYLELGMGPPVEWSAGHFTGDFVETYIGDGGFEGMTTTLFHEAAHQFVSLATNAVGWLNEGLASFFEGTRILANGTVIMNMPANHRLFPLAERMERGWMEDEEDGFDPADSTVSPEKAPTFAIVLENRYEWGPPWYAPTWGVVYFLYNYQDPVDGRFVYRNAFDEFIDSSGGRVGSGAVQNFEEVILANPREPYDGVEREGRDGVPLPRTAAELDEVWKQWMLDLRDEQQGKSEVERPYHDWGRYAAANGDYRIALEHYEKGLVADPDDIELLMEFADLLHEHFANDDRAARFVLEALHFMEQAEQPDEKRIRDAERLLSKLDPKRRTLTRIQDDLAETAVGIVRRYQAAELPAMVMDVSWRLGTELGIGELFDYYEEALRVRGRSIAIWQLAYDEESLKGWNDRPDDAYRAAGSLLETDFGEFSEDDFDYQLLTLDEISSGDFSLEAQVQANKGEVNFCGLVFGRKDANNFHGLVYFPGKTVVEGVVEAGFVDLMSSFGGTPRVWRHVPVEGGPRGERSSAGDWHRLRLDVTGKEVDLWFDGELLATHPFGSVDVVRGSFGLITGPGKARFREVRYLDRHPKDPASRIERTIRLEELREASGGTLGGSYLGMSPPFPGIERWVQAERRGWQEALGAPQLLVLFSIPQNDLVAIDGWLMALHERTREIDLHIVCVSQFQDLTRLEAYLAQHPLPGAVGVDRHGQTFRGEFFEAFGIERFNLPRLLLIDVDGTVVWEGDPGLSADAPWQEGLATYLADPLAELIGKRRLVDLARWRAAWQERGSAALATGDLAGAAQLLREAEAFPEPRAPQAEQAARKLQVIEASLADLEELAERLVREEAQPAIGALIEWAELFGVAIPRQVQRDLRSAERGDISKDWAAALKTARGLVARTPDAERLERYVEELQGYRGRFPRELAEDLGALLAAGGDDRAVHSLLELALHRPGRYIVRNYYGW